MQDIIDMELEEYIPLKIIFNKDEEAVEYIQKIKLLHWNLQWV